MTDAPPDTGADHAPEACHPVPAIRAPHTATSPTKPATSPASNASGTGPRHPSHGRRGRPLHRHPHPDLAPTSALEGVALALLDDHLRHCVVSAAARGGPEAEEKLQRGHPRRSPASSKNPDPDPARPMRGQTHSRLIHRDR